MKKTSQINTIIQESQKSSQKPLVLKLKNPKPQKKVTWTEDTVDNEHLGKKKSNICCIFTPPPDQRLSTCSSDSNNELERSEETKKEHLKNCSKRHTHTCH